MATITSDSCNYGEKGGSDDAFARPMDDGYLTHVHVDVWTDPWLANGDRMCVEITVKVMRHCSSVADLQV